VVLGGDGYGSGVRWCRGRVGAPSLGGIYRLWALWVGDAFGVAGNNDKWSAGSNLCSGWMYAVGVAKELNAHIKFSVRCMSIRKDVLLMALAAVACRSLGIGYAAHVEREGFSIPGVF